MSRMLVISAYIFSTRAAASSISSAQITLASSEGNCAIRNTGGALVFSCNETESTVQDSCAVQLAELRTAVAALNTKIDAIIHHFGLLPPPSVPPASPPAPPVTDLARDIVPTGSSDSGWGRYPGLTDGSGSSVWHAANGDSLSGDGAYLVLDLGVPRTITSMVLVVSSGSLNYGFRNLQIQRATSANSWTTVRTDGPYGCSSGRQTTHAGWSELTRYVKITLLNLCAGGHFSLATWEVLGY